MTATVLADSVRLVISVRVSIWHVDRRQLFLFTHVQQLLKLLRVWRIFCWCIQPLKSCFYTLLVVLAAVPRLQYLRKNVANESLSFLRQLVLEDVVDLALFQQLFDSELPHQVGKNLFQFLVTPDSVCCLQIASTAALNPYAFA